MIALLGRLFISCLTIGLFSYGGGFAVISLLQRLVERNDWMSTERFADFVAISQSTPGPIAINIATFVGYHVGGVPGALVATSAVALPGMVLMVLFALMLFHFYEKPAFQSIFKGLRPAVLGLIAAAAWQIGRVAIIDWRTAAMTLVCCVLIVRWRLHPISLVLGSALAGMLLF